MTIPRTTAKKLCTDVEYRLVNESFVPHVAELSEKGLAQRIKRTRAARDKYRSLAERQTREARGRIDPHGARAAAGNKNTRVKQALFDETLARYEKQVSRMNKDAVPKRSAPIAASSRKARSVAQKDDASQRTSRTESAVKTAKVTKAAKAPKTGKAANGMLGGSATGTSKPAEASSTRKAQIGKSAAQPVASGAESKMAGRGKVQAATVGKKTGARKGAADAAGMKSVSVPKSSTASKASAVSKPSAKRSKKKSASRTPASRAGTITRPIKIPPLKQVLAAVSDVVAARKEAGQSTQEAPPARSHKAPAVTNDGAPPGSPAAVDGVNRKGPEFPRNTHERGRVSAAFKRQQARRDSR